MSHAEKVRRNKIFIKKKKKKFEALNYTCERCGYSIAIQLEEFAKLILPTGPKRVKEYHDARSVILGQIQMHHIVPLSKKGNNKDSNLITLCEDCHVAIHKQEQEEDRKRLEGRRIKAVVLAMKGKPRINENN